MKYYLNAWKVGLELAIPQFPNLPFIASPTKMADPIKIFTIFLYRLYMNFSHIYLKNEISLTYNHYNNELTTYIHVTIFT